MTDKSSLISIKNLVIKNEEGNVIVNNVSFDVKQGEVFGFVGESGSGKTLTVKSIVNLLPKNLRWACEEMLVFDKDFAKITDKEKRWLVGKSIGFVPQNTVFYLHPMIKIKNQIADGYTVYNKKSKKEGIAKARGLMKMVGFTDPERVLNSYPWQLSGGMRQRVNIALALMNDPKVIIADEPTTALDSTIQAQVLELFKNINENMDVSVVFISHDLGVVKKYCHRIAVMYAGQIVEGGMADQLFKEPKHPYTKALIKVIPSLNIVKGQKLEEIPGFVPETGRDVSGCVFRQRCNFATHECEEYVIEHKFGDSHFCKCNHCED